MTCNSPRTSLTSHGLKSVEELKKKFKEDIERTKIELNKIEEPTVLQKTKEKIEELKADADDKISRSKEASKRAAMKESKSKPDIKDLSTFVDIDKLSLHEPKEIELIWKARFAGKKNTICGAVNGITFSRIFKKARRYPIFLIPMPVADQGFELHYMQWNFASPTTLHCIITSLAEYKLHQEYATPHTTLIFHSDLLADKELVLMNGTIETDRNIGEDDATLLALQVQRFYGADESTERGLQKVQLLDAFTSGTDLFKLDDLIEEIQRLD